MREEGREGRRGKGGGGRASAYVWCARASMTRSMYACMHSLYASMCL